MLVVVESYEKWLKNLICRKCILSNLDSTNCKPNDCFNIEMDEDGSFVNDLAPEDVPKPPLNSVSASATDNKKAVAKGMET